MHGLSIAVRGRASSRRARAGLLYRRLRVEPLEERRLLDASTPWSNPRQAVDVNADGFVSPIDALIVINRLNLVGTLPALVPGQTEPPPYYDAFPDNVLTSLDALAVLNYLNADQAGPALALGLVNDTGPGGQNNNDGITSDPTISGTVTDQNKIVSFNGSVDNGPTSSWMAYIGLGGSVLLSPDTLATLKGSSLADGPHVLHLSGMDELGHTSARDVSFTLKRTGSPTPVPDLADSSDLGTSDIDNFTSDNTPTITVAAEPGSLVTLLVDGGQVGQALANPLATFTLNPLADGVHQIRATNEDGAGNVGGSSSPLSVSIATTNPTVKMSLLPVIDDVTPQVTVTATAPAPLPDGSLVTIDVDLNNDGQYLGNELNYTTATLFGGAATFQIAPALPKVNPEGGLNTVKIKARVQDPADNEGSFAQSVIISTSTSTALKDYVQKDDGQFAYSRNSTINGPGYTAYIMDMTSQQWRSPTESSRSIWRHWVTIIVPSGAVTSTALLFITGGSISDTPPSVDAKLAQAAVLTRSVMITLYDVPNEPIFFSDESPPRGRSEDEIIAYTYDKFLNDTSQKDWPLLLPMVKSAVKAMDMVQQFVPTIDGGQQITDFLVSGASKRGWTTWLTAAVDDRVRAIVPMVFDALNLDEQMVHHYGVYGFFSSAIEDYGEMRVFDRILTAQGLELGKIVDPYTYLYAGRYNIPKLLINSPGDQFFVTDSAQFYVHDLPGQTYLRYIPNTGHGLDASAGDSLTTFFAAVLAGAPLPQFSWTIQPDGAIRVQTVTAPTQVLMWQATNPNARDFRQSYNPPDLVKYTSSTMTDQGGGVYVANVATPATGATAFFIEMTFPSLVPGVPYKFTTEVRVASNQALFPWPFPIFGGAGAAAALDGAAMGASAGAATTALEESARGALLSALAQTASATTSGPVDASGLAAVVGRPELVVPVAAPVPPDDDEPSGIGSAAAAASTGQADGLDALFGSDAELDDALAADAGLSAAKELLLALS